MSSRLQALWTPRSLSVVVPLFDEEGNAEPLVRGIVAAVRPLHLPFEVIVVDDGSSDATLEVLRELLVEVPELVVIALRRNFGQTLALQAGLDRARGDALVTMDGDLQNDPSDIPHLVQALCQGADVVSGWRKDRQDTLFLRKIPSWVANRLIRFVTRINIHDQGCSLKAYRREVVKGLDLYADMHRFIAILTMPLGATIAEVEVQHHARISGSSKYGLSRIFKVMADLFTIQMLTWFRERPMRWFTLLGMPFLVASLVATFLALTTGASSVVLSALVLITSTTFLSCLLLGLVAEFVLATMGSNPAPVARELGDRS
ncbi:MAG: glycosyltransferase family 2 protein [Deltaproteobacteria bacterium]|nr:glycosyltransferase family 2 protein [Deltaproteobacteria bacterium]MBW2361432.1 glycosyltransferase family 2 protein [Deltaproteobacteria bacterium]